MMSEEYKYECPEDLDEQTKVFMDMLELKIGPYGIKRDDSLEFARWCLMPVVEPQDQFMIVDVDDFLELYVGAV